MYLIYTDLSLPVTWVWSFITSVLPLPSHINKIKLPNFIISVKCRIIRSHNQIKSTIQDIRSKLKFSSCEIA